MDVSLIDCESNGNEIAYKLVTPVAIWLFVVVAARYIVKIVVPLCLVLQEFLLFFVCHLVISFVYVLRAIEVSLNAFCRVVGSIVL